MDSVDIENIEASIKEIQASFVKAQNDEGSEDTVDELTRDLGEMLGNMVYVANGPNDFEVDDDALQELEAVGTIAGDRNNPKLLIDNPLDEYEKIEVRIIDPTEQ
jgi:hypothetical protein